MKRKQFLSGLAVLLLSVSPGVAAAEKNRDAEDADMIRERIRLYLRRHGDNGVIDPDRRRALVARDYKSRRAEEASRRLSPQGIGAGNWVSLGPTNGAGRVTAIAPHPSFPGTVYIGAAGGGVWKTSDGGTSWTPLTDGLNDLSVGALAVAPSSPNILYLGTGEGGYAVDFIPGIGMLTSNDGGASWAVPPSVVASTFYRISVHPGIPQELVAGTNQGGLRTTDGGATWTTVISRNFYGDVSDIVRHPADPKILYAATWCVNNCAAGIGRVLKSTDGGATWVEKSFGLPTGGPQAGSSFRFNERLAIAISATNPLVLYAATGVTDNSGNVTSHIYKTSNGGESWTDLPAVSAGANARYLGDQSWYDNTIVVSPTDPNFVLAGGVRYVRSTDGGATFAPPPFDGSAVHVDAHDLRYQGTVLYIGNDGGVWATLDNGLTSADRNTGLVVRQYYALANDPVNRNRILAGSQDNGTNQRPDAGGTSWKRVIGSDGFECGVNPAAPTISYGTIQFGSIQRSKNSGTSGTPAFSGISPPFSSDEPTPFLSLLTVHPASPSTIYTGSNRLWKSENGGDTWLPLPTATADGSSWPTSTLVTAIALSRGDPAVLMVAKSRAVFRSADGGRTWVAASSGLPGLVINNLEIDPSNAGVAYAALAATGGTSVYATTNGGISWSPRSTGLPAFAAQVVRVDPTDSNTLFCGTDVGVFRSTDQGATWAKFGSGLPSSSVQDLRILDDGSVLRAATHGRGVWELEIPPSGNTPPSAVISLPATAVTAAKGSTISFSGLVSDADPGDAATGSWNFSDTWESVPVSGGATTVSHTFVRAGVFPVSLAARDSRGALASSFVTVTISDASDSCATPLVLPGAGPFPHTVLVNSESAGTEGSDPVPSSCAPAGLGIAASVWLEFTPAVAATYEISTCGAGADTVLAIFTGPACGPYTLVAGGCNDDATAGPACGDEHASLVSVSLTALQTVRIQVTGFLSADTGTIPVTVRPATVPDTVPRVTGLSRFTGPSSGGTTVALYGFGFGSGTTVTFGGVPAGNVTVLDPRYLTATTPAHLPGTVDVVVTRPGGSGKLAAAYDFVLPAGIEACAATETVQCLNGGRFKVQVAWSVPAQGASGIATAVPLTSDTAYFWFFSSNNVEIVLKVVDGRAVNNNFWVFYGGLTNVQFTITITDTATGAVRTYSNPSGTLASVADTAAFGSGMGVVETSGQSKVEGLRSRVGESDRAVMCNADGQTLCLNANRFQVQVSWRVPPQGTSGAGTAVPLTSDTGYFWFFTSNNVELVLKVVDGRPVNDRFWVFYGALSNVEYTITVTDTETGTVKTYFNPFGSLASVADTSAF